MGAIVKMQNFKALLKVRPLNGRNGQRFLRLKQTA